MLRVNTTLIQPATTKEIQNLITFGSLAVITMSVLHCYLKKKCNDVDKLATFICLSSSGFINADQNNYHAFNFRFQHPRLKKISDHTLQISGLLGGLLLTAFGCYLGNAFSLFSSKDSSNNNATKNAYHALRSNNTRILPDRDNQENNQTIAVVFIWTGLFVLILAATACAKSKLYQCISASPH